MAGVAETVNASLWPQPDVPLISLGERYFDKTNEARADILQVDTSCGITETFGSVRNKAIMVATDLTNRNVNSNDRVLIFSKTNMDLAPTMLGIWFTGAVVCPVNPELELDECVGIVGKLKPRVAFCDKRSQGFLIQVLAACKNSHCVKIVFGHGSFTTIGMGIIYNRKLDESYRPHHIEKPKHRIAVILPTEGTTELSKLVEISHYAMLVRHMQFDMLVGRRASRAMTYYSFASMQHIMLFLYCLEKNATFVYPGKLSEKHACRVLHDLRIELALIDTARALKLADYLSTSQDFQLPILRRLITGFGSTSAQQLVRIMDSFQLTIVLNVYFCVECGLISGGSTLGTTSSCAVQDKDMVSTETQELKDLLAVRPGSCGKLLPGVRVKISPMTSCDELHMEEEYWGEICVSTSALMSGYLDNPELTKSFMRNGYYCTGDIGQLDSDGWLYIQCRSSEYLVRNDHKFAAVEIEEAVTMHKNVGEAAVFGNDIIACVVPRSEEGKEELGVEDLENFVSEILPDYKQPGKFVICDTLPKTPNGQVQKYKLSSSIRHLGFSSSSTNITYHT